MEVPHVVCRAIVHYNQFPTRVGLRKHGVLTLPNTSGVVRGHDDANEVLHKLWLIDRGIQIGGGGRSCRLQAVCARDRDGT
jgi:hypothetical protein